MDEKFIKIEEKYSGLEEEFRKFRNQLLLTRWEEEKGEKIKLIDKGDVDKIEEMHDDMEKAYEKFIRYLKDYIK